MKKKLACILMALMVTVSVFAGNSQVEINSLASAKNASTQVTFDLKAEDVSYYMFGFMPYDGIWRSKPNFDFNELEEIKLSMNSDKTGAENPKAGRVYYFIQAAELPTLTLKAGKGLSRPSSQKIIGYDISIQGKTEKSGDGQGTVLDLKGLDGAGYTSGYFEFGIKTNTPLTPDMASEEETWSDTITLTISHA